MKSLTTQYVSSKKGWMTSFLFEDWIEKLNARMVKNNRKIIMFVDNAPSHKISKNFSNVHLEFLPPNLTSVIQPMDQGIISQIKRLYRKDLLRRLIADIEFTNQVTEAVKKIDVLDAMRWLEAAWKQASFLLFMLLNFNLILI